MGHRSWMIEITDESSAGAVKRWLLNVEDRQNTDWGLYYVSTCLRKDGSRWALVVSNGSGCVGHLGAYGYRSGRVWLLGEAPEWDRSEGKLGAYADALYSAYLDAGGEEFVREDSPELEAQFGQSVVFLTDDQAQARQLREKVRAMASEMEPRVVPRASSDLYNVTEAGATLFGVCIHALQPDILARLTLVVGLAQMPERDVPSGVAPGFMVSSEDKYVHVMGEDGARKVPLVGAEMSDEALIDIGHANATEQFRARCRRTLTLSGYKPAGGAYSAEQSTDCWSKRVRVDGVDLKINVSCTSERVGTEDGAPPRFERKVKITGDWPGRTFGEREPALNGEAWEVPEESLADLPERLSRFETEARAGRPAVSGAVSAEP